jgi:hypothetical protein
MWDYVARNAEVITNTLDLLSFLLVTPELLRIIQPPFMCIFKLVASLIGSFVLATVFFKYGITTVYHTGNVTTFNDVI